MMSACDFLLDENSLDIERWERTIRSARTAEGR